MSFGLKIIFNHVFLNCLHIMCYNFIMKKIILFTFLSFLNPFNNSQSFKINTTFKEYL